MEGDSCYPACTASCNTAGLTPPINEYGHDAAGGTAIIGGFVYHGSSMPRFVGSYIFGDLSSGHIWGLAQDAQGNWQRTLLLTHALTVRSFGRD